MKRHKWSMSREQQRERKLRQLLRGMISGPDLLSEGAKRVRDGHMSVRRASKKKREGQA